MYRRLARFNKSAKKTSVAAPYVVFNPHSITPICLLPHTGQSTVVTIDPGVKNCAIRCGTWDPQTQLITTNLLIKVNFTSRDFTDEAGSDIGSDTSYYASIFNALEPYEVYFTAAQYIGIESQYVENMDLIRISQHIITFLMTMVRNKGNRPIIIELDARLKTQMLGAPPKMDKPQRKAWAAEMSKRLLISMGEHHIAKFIDEQRKDDDFGDVVCYERVIYLLLNSGVNALPQPTRQPPPPIQKQITQPKRDLSQLLITKAPPNVTHDTQHNVVPITQPKRDLSKLLIVRPPTQTTPVSLPVSSGSVMIPRIGDTTTYNPLTK